MDRAASSIRKPKHLPTVATLALNSIFGSPSGGEKHGGYIDLRPRRNHQGGSGNLRDKETAREDLLSLDKNGTMSYKDIHAKLRKQ